VGAHHYRFPSGALLFEDIFDQLRIYRVKRAEGFVDDDDLWIVDEGGN